MLRYYWAYGSNLNVAHMAERCPGAVQYKALALPNGALMFRGVADVVLRKGSTVHGGLWQITRACEAALDRYEGIKSGLYRKCYLTLKIRGDVVSCLYYKMNQTPGFYPPDGAYIDCIAQGYRDFGLPLDALNDALVETAECKRPSEYFRARHKRRGGGPLVLRLAE